MHAPREPFWSDDEPDQPRAIDITNRIALVRRYALVVPGLFAVLAIGAAWSTGIDLVTLWREVPVVRLGAIGLAAWLAGGIGWLLVEVGVLSASAVWRQPRQRFFNYP